MHVEETYAFACPYCWQSTAIQLEMPHGVIELVEDCQVCCRPMTFFVTFDELDFTVSIATEPLPAPTSHTIERMFKFNSASAIERTDRKSVV